MIPGIALMLGSYIGFRMLEVLLKPVAPFGGMWQAIVVKCLAGIALVVSSAACFDILMSGAKMLPLH